MRMGPDLFNLCEPPRVCVFIEPPAGGPCDDDRLVVIRMAAKGYPARVARSYIGRYSPEPAVFEALARAFVEMSAWERWPTKEEFGAWLGECLREVDPF